MRPSLAAGSRAALAAGAAAVVLSSVALVGDLSIRTAPQTTYGTGSPAFAVLEAVVGAALLCAALVLLAERATAVLGALAACAALAWFAPVWVGWDGGPGVVRGVALVVAPLLPAAVLGIAVHAPPRAGVGRVAGSALTVLAGAAALGAALALVLVRDPLRDPDCWSDCTAGAFAIRDDPELARRATSIALGIAVATGLLAALVGVLRLARAAATTRRSSGPVFCAGAIAGAALASYALALLETGRETPASPLYEALFAARAAALLGLAAALLWLALRPQLVRARVTRLAVDLQRTGAEGGIGSRLSHALGDPALRLSYPFGADGRVVDAEGRAVAPQPSSRVTPLVGEHGVVALVESDVTTADALERELGPAAQLALGNERLRAEALARLADARASRARIVETADAARRRIERDLHDGAQQRMLALTFDLQVALTHAESTGNEQAATPLRAALARAGAASAELRAIAHGIFPAELAASGLQAALESLADVRPMRLAVDLPAGRRYDAELEAAAYALVADATDDAADLHVTVADARGRLRIALVGGVDDHKTVRIEDRAAAVGGSVRRTARGLEATLPLSGEARRARTP